MLRLLAACVLVFPLMAGCGTRSEPEAAVEAGSVELWLERMRETESVRFDIEQRTEGRRPTWWTKQGAMSPMSNGFYPSDAPEPTGHLIHRYKSFRDDSTVEYEAIERDSGIWLRDPRATMPPGKRWVKLDLKVSMALYHRHKDITMALDAVHPSGVFVDFDRRSRVVSAGVREEDGTVRYELTAGAGVETNPNTARGGRVTGTVWIGKDGLPVRIEQRSTGDNGDLHVRTSRFTGWNTTPAVGLPAPDEVAGPAETKLPEW